ncbi:hypothetical protein AVEN_218142-1 [Araneus ventricosus]|uniref:Uncharacterized protein n=1 Tax=Araneus ventricosus TaxID=182803 RepID=A0A4Y2VQ00_ARAVE|nr:hypothetical protein AVEN_243901-1 [Araneus ventricosus]GBO25824.1 hypothetical protein AVEN_218142-1 [Araneus ventricosus]
MTVAKCNTTELLAVQQPIRWRHLSEALLVNGRVGTALVQKPSTTRNAKKEDMSKQRRCGPLSGKDGDAAIRVENGNAKVVMESSI